MMTFESFFLLMKYQNYKQSIVCWIYLSSLKEWWVMKNRWIADSIKDYFDERIGKRRIGKNQSLEEKVRLNLNQ